MWYKTTRRPTILCSQTYFYTTELHSLFPVWFKLQLVWSRIHTYHCNHFFLSEFEYKLFRRNMGQRHCLRLFTHWFVTGFNNWMNIDFTIDSQTFMLLGSRYSKYITYYFSGNCIISIPYLVGNEIFVVCFYNTNISFK